MKKCFALNFLYSIKLLVELLLFSRKPYILIGHCLYKFSEMCSNDDGGRVSERARNKELSAKIINSRGVLYVDKIHFHEEQGNYNIVICIFHSDLSAMTHKY